MQSATPPEKERVTSWGISQGLTVSFVVSLHNMSAGGPIVSPKASAIVVTPISPHSLTSKSVVFDSTEEICVEIMKKRKTQETEAIVSFDGSNSIELSAGDVVNVKLSARSISLIKMYDVNFYTVLRDKIGG